MIEAPRNQSKSLTFVLEIIVNRGFVMLARYLGLFRRFFN